MAAHQAPLSLGFSRQEHWSGLPFPSPMHESEKSKWSRSVVSYSSQPHGLQPTRLLRPWDFPGKSTGVGCHCLLQHSDSISLLILSVFLSFSQTWKRCRTLLVIKMLLVTGCISVHISPKISYFFSQEEEVARETWELTCLFLTHRDFKMFQPTINI